MTSGGNNFNDFPENKLTKVRAVLRLLRQIRSGPRHSNITVLQKL